MMDEVERRLIGWADWQAKEHALGLGYPGLSAIVQLDIPRGRAPWQVSSVPVESHVEAMAGWIVELGKYYPHLTQVLHVYYLDSDLMPQKAARLGYAYGKFKIYLDQAKYWLAGRLNAEMEEDMKEYASHQPGMR